jgi:hypothetical protein
MKHEAIEDHVERSVGEPKLAGVTDVRRVGASGLEHSSDSLWVRIDRGHPEGR